MHHDADWHLELFNSVKAMLRRGREIVGLEYVVGYLVSAMLCADDMLFCYDTPISVFCVILRKHCLICVYCHPRSLLWPKSLY